VTLGVTWCTLALTLVRLTRLKRRRLERGWTLQDLAHASGITSTSLSYLERGKREPKPATIRRLAEALQCDARELMEPE
jgi:transcriptional regulator with XRE-family HTH domain